MSGSRPEPTTSTRPLRFILAAGGTGGHVYPAIAIADAILEVRPDSEILFVGTRDRMEWTTVPKAGYRIEPIWITGFERKWNSKNLLFPIRLITSLYQSRRILKRFRPDAVIACGGFASGPIGWEAVKKKIPLFLQEQNSLPGVTTRMLAHESMKVFLAFEDKVGFFDGLDTEVLGNPIRRAFKTLGEIDREQACRSYGLDPSRPVLLFLGGSGGAVTMNEMIADQVLELIQTQMPGLQVVWQTGPRYHERFKEKVESIQHPDLHIHGYLENMPHAYVAADLVVSRAGASTCSELLHMGCPSILVPSPFVASDHQTRNAESMVEAGASVMVREKEGGRVLSDAILHLLSSPKRLKEMATAARRASHSDAAQIIADRILTTLETGPKGPPSTSLLR